MGNENLMSFGHAATYEDLERIPPTGLVARIAGVLRIWDASTFHPFILAINTKSIDDDQKANLYALLESYIVRREICGLTTKNYNKVVTGLVRQIRGSADPLNSVRKHFAALKGDASLMPSDLKVGESVARRPADSEMPTPRLRYILEQLEYIHRGKFDEVIVLTRNDKGSYGSQTAFNRYTG